MSENYIQASFNSGEWSPKLFARVDMQKYRSGAALLSNFFVDYRGGASTRPGTKYIIQGRASATKIRLIPFQATATVGYACEFGNQYVRFIFNGAPILETATSITAAAPGPPEVFTDTAHGYSNGDWIFVQNSYYIVQGVTANTFTITDLFGNAINTNPFTLPAAPQRVYTISSPYLPGELAQIKYAQNVNQLILLHPNHQPYVLTLVAATNWTLNPIVFSPPILPPPPGVVIASNAVSGTDNIAYIITTVDANGSESAPTPPVHILNRNFTSTSTRWTNTINWGGVAGAASYNVYKSYVSNAGPVANGASYGFIGNVTDSIFKDSFIGPNFSITPPIVRNPFFGASISTLTITAAGSGFTAPPAVTISNPGAGGIIATASCALTTVNVAIAAGGSSYVVGDVIDTASSGGVQATVTTVAAGVITGISVLNAGGWSSGPVPGNPVSTFAHSPSTGTGATLNLTWGITALSLGSPGTGFLSTPTVSFSPNSGATATATLGAAATGNPTVPGFFQQRLVLAGNTASPQAFNMSQPAGYFNFNTSAITTASDAISGTLVSGVLNTIKAMVPQSAGLLVLTDRNSWVINGGGGLASGSSVSPSNIVANPQSFNGISDVPPIVANFDVLFVQAKGSVVRDSAYNIYANVYTGTDISILSSHLFYGFTINEWAWAEEPFKVVWAVRSDGTMLTLTFLKEQEFIGWAHSSTPGGTFQSVCTVVETTATAGQVDAIYTVVQRTVQGQSLQYIERVAERTFGGGAKDSWCVDSALQYVGAPATAFSGGQNLAGLTVTGLADGVIIPPFVMPLSGAFTLSPAASKVTVGIGYTCQLQTLALDLGEPTIQGKLKKIPYATVRLADTLNLQIGSSFTSLVTMKDTIVGNVSSTLTGQPSQVVNGLVTGDARTFLDSTYTIPGQYCIQQSNPLPATVLGVIAAYSIGDDK